MLMQATIKLTNSNAELFPLNLIGKLTMALLTGQSWCILNSWYTDRLNQKFSSIYSWSLERYCLHQVFYCFCILYSHMTLGLIKMYVCMYVTKALNVISSILIDHTAFNFTCHYKHNVTTPLTTNVHL